MVLNVMDNEIEINGITVISNIDTDFVINLDRAAFCSCDICIFGNEEVLYDEFGEFRFVSRDVSIGDKECCVKFENGFRFSVKDVKFENVYHFEQRYNVLRNLSELEETGDKHSLVILETPSAFLHPKEEIELGKVLVDMTKKGFSFLLDTNSTYLLRAIEVFSAKEGSADKCKYYLFSGQGIEDVTVCTNKIYETFTKPLEELKQIEYMEVL